MVFYVLRAFGHLSIQTWAIFLIETIILIFARSIETLYIIPLS